MVELPATVHDEHPGLSAAAAILLLDRLGVVRAATPGACLALSRAQDRLTGKPLHEFVPGAKSRVYPWVNALEGCEEVPAPRLLDVDADCGGQTQRFDGILYALRVGTAGAAGAPVAGLLLRPSSFLLGRSQALDAQQTVLDQIARGATLRDTLREVARFAERQMPAETFCAIVTTNDTGTALGRAVVAGLPRSMAEPYAGNAIDPPMCPAAAALAAQHPVIAADLDVEANWRAFADSIRRHGVRAVWSYPVKQGSGGRRAVLDFLLTAPRTPSAAESRIAEQMAALAGLALDLDHLRAELAARTANLASIVATLPVVVWETDALGRITLIDGGALATVKLHAADVVGKPSDQAFGASDATQALVRRALAGESVWGDVATLGRMFAIGVAPIRNSSGGVRGMRGLALDITDRTDAERALRDSSERLNLVIDASSDGFWDYRLGGEGSMVSDRCAHMLGYAAGAMPVATPDCHPLVHTEDRAAVRQAWQDHLSGRSPRYESEHRRLAADGTARWILERGRVVERDAAGSPVRVAGTQTDVTDRRVLEQSALTAQKMDALAQVARGFAHDLSNVLAAIRGHAALGALSHGLSPRVAESLEVIQLAAARGRALTQDMMALGTPAPIQRRVTRVGDALRETLRLLTPVIPPQVAVETDVPEDIDDRVMADPNLLQQVLLNLLLRARDAMPSGGTLRVRIDRAPREPHGSDVRVRVCDTGAGIAPADLPHVFDPFYVRPEGGVGAGLALALVRSFVDSSGGRIEVTSEPGQGCSFLLSLPGADDHRAEDPALRHLIVLGEGHSLLRPMLAEALQQSGYDIHAPETREAYLEALQRLAHRSGAVVVDANFIQLSPAEIAQQARLAAGRPVPVIVAAGPQDAGLELEGLSVIPKPFDLEALRLRLQALLSSAG